MRRETDLTRRESIDVGWWRKSRRVHSGRDTEKGASMNFNVGVGMGT